MIVQQTTALFQPAVNRLQPQKIFKITNPMLAELVDDSTHLPDDHATTLDKLLDFYREHQQNETQSFQARHAFLTLLMHEIDYLQLAPAAQFLANEIEAADFDILQWESPVHMLEFCEAIYGFRFADETIAQDVRGHISYLLQQALRHYEETKEWEALFSLVEIAPTSPMMSNLELRRLRHLARVYELRRIRRNRLILYSYLLVQILLVLVVFPLLFINAENGELQRRVEELANVNIGDDGYRLFTYTDGLYWAVITAASIGYGDITPVTTTGKLIAGTLGTLGVVTVGVIAGLVLKWITPRSLD